MFVVNDAPPHNSKFYGGSGLIRLRNTRSSFTLHKFLRLPQKMLEYGWFIFHCISTFQQHECPGQWRAWLCQTLCHSATKERPWPLQSLRLHSPIISAGSLELWNRHLSAFLVLSQRTATNPNRQFTIGCLSWHH